jgi:dienelactone hydrolase
VLNTALRTLLSAVLAPLLRIAGSWPPTPLAEPGPTGVRIDERGVLGNYYPAIGGARSAGILLVGGSDGGISRFTALDAAALQEADFAVLALSYFRGPGQSTALSEIPLETFDRALDWLRARPDVDAARLGIVGFSKGAEAALLTASRRHDVGAVVAGAPTSVIWPGFDWAKMGAVATSSWSVGGRPLPCLPYGRFSLRGGMRSLFETGLRQRDSHPESIIPVERIRAPVLLVCGGADQVWPSCEMAKQIQARLAANQAREASLLEYPNADHGAFGSPSAEARRFGRGPEPAASRTAREDSWPKVVRFLEDHLK